MSSHEPKHNGKKNLTGIILVGGSLWNSNQLDVTVLIIYKYGIASVTVSSSGELILHTTTMYAC